MQTATIAAIAALLAARPAAAEPIVIVHGAFQSAAGWTEVECLLKAEGHEVTLVDLPGRDATGEAVKAIPPDANRDAALEAARASGAPVVLVGHSFGDMIISAAAEAEPAAVRQLIYVAAYVPGDGDSMETLALSDAENAFREDSFVVAPDWPHAEVLERDRAEIFANDADEARRETILAGMVREPLAPSARPSRSRRTASMRCPRPTSARRATTPSRPRSRPA